MKKLYFLGAAANYSRRQRLAHTFAIGTKKDIRNLENYLGDRYHGEAILTKNGRSALALTLKAYFKKGSYIIVNGFTCYAVVEAVEAAGMVPIFADINKKDLNFTVKTLNNALVNLREGQPGSTIGIIVQNSLGNTVDIKAIQDFARKHNLKIIEDLAHCAGAKYANGQEVGTVGVATVLSFGKDKSIDTISGGAVILREKTNEIAKPKLRPRISDHLRERFYPMFGAMSRGLTRIHLGGLFMRFLVATHQVQKSADNKLEMNRKISKFEAKLALRQIQELRDQGPIRGFYLIKDREKALKELRTAGYYFDGFWYEKPVSPTRYYSKVNFPEDLCPVAVDVANKIINVPTYYTKKQLASALKIVNKYAENN